MRYQIAALILSGLAITGAASITTAGEAMAKKGADNSATDLRQSHGTDNATKTTTATAAPTTDDKKSQGTDNATKTTTATAAPTTDVKKSHGTDDATSSSQSSQNRRGR